MGLEWDYWHRIDKINPENKELKNNSKTGALISKSYRDSGRWETINLETGEESWTFEVIYVGRTPKGLKKTERLKLVKELWKKSQKKREKKVSED